MLIDNCQQQCVCHAGQGVVCQAHSCKPGQVCEPSGGVLSCITKGAGLGRGPGWLGTDDRDPRAEGGGNPHFYRGRHRGLRIEVSIWGPLGWDFYGQGQSAAGMGGRDSYGRIQAVWIYFPGLRFLGQVSETLSIRQGQANFFPKGPGDKYLNLEGLRGSVITTQLCHRGVKSAIDYVSEGVRIS